MLEWLILLLRKTVCVLVALGIVARRQPRLTSDICEPLWKVRDRLLCSENGVRVMALGTIAWLLVSEQNGFMPLLDGVWRPLSDLYS